MYTELDMWVDDVRQDIYYDHILQDHGFGLWRFATKIYRQLMLALGFIETPVYNQQQRYLNIIADRWMTAVNPVEHTANVYISSAYRHQEPL